MQAIGTTTTRLSAPTLAPRGKRPRVRREPQPAGPAGILVYAVPDGLLCAVCALWLDGAILVHPQLVLPASTPRCVDCGRAIR